MKDLAQLLQRERERESYARVIYHIFSIRQNSRSHAISKYMTMAVFLWLQSIKIN